MELYEHQDCAGRSVILDFQDRFMEPWTTFLGEIDDFNDRAHSISSCIPAGLTITAWSHGYCSGSALPFFGAEAFTRLADLGSLGDRISWLSRSGTVAVSVWVSRSRSFVTRQAGTFNKPTLGIKSGLSQRVGPVNKLFIEAGFYNEKVTFVKPIQVIASPGTVVIGAPN